MVHENISIHWFRQDLRLFDNPALSMAAKHKNVLPLYIFDNQNAKDFALGAASRWWLHHSLTALSNSLMGKLSLYRGNPLSIFEHLFLRFDIKAIYWNRCYEPWRIEVDQSIKEHFRAKGVRVVTCNASLLWEPWTVKKKDGSFYKVFSSFYERGCLQSKEPRSLFPKAQIASPLYDTEYSLTLNQLALLAERKWYEKFEKYWKVGEQAAHSQFAHFLSHGLSHYKEGRDFPAQTYVSNLSPYLHFGQISPHQLWHTINSGEYGLQGEHFCRELAWREFSYSQLYYYRELPTKNLQKKFDHFPWSTDTTLLGCWQKGETGIPMIDAGMRQLWESGYMHNRVRMITASFLTKNLRLHWIYGARWFWNTLVDADLASNSASWQWAAGCGADAAPYFRIFNPVLQGLKFDSNGIYVRKFVPEIAALPNKYLFQPWQAPKSLLKTAGIELGKNYPQPIVDLKKSRLEALAAFHTLNAKSCM